MKKDFNTGLRRSVEADRVRLTRRRRQLLRAMGLAEDLDSTEERHWHSSNDSEDALVSSFTYDDRGRLLGESHSLNGFPFGGTSYAYDALGRLAGKTSGSGSSTVAETLAYDIRGWLTGKTGNVFSESLRYTFPQRQGTVPCFTGDISEWGWSNGVGNETYAFSYDSFGRLTDSRLFVGNASSMSGTFSERGVAYDRNGNILSMTRLLDAASAPESLSFSYEGNRLAAVSGAGPYAHDVSGNLTRDGRDGLDISYDMLGMTSSVRKDGSLLGSYTFLSDGTKRSALKSNGTGHVYAGSMVYTRDISGALSLECVLTGGGRLAVDRSPDGGVSYRPLIHVTDHLGSVRAVVDASTGAVIERNDYLPFGLRRPATNAASGTATGSETSPNRWLFSGKESQSFLGADIPLLDFGARMYDPTTARWTAIDPMAEDYHGVSPYAYCLGNPISIIDPNGRWITLYYNGHEYRYQDGQFLQYQTEGNNAGSYVPTSDAQVQSLGGMLTELSKVKTGKSLIDYFSNDENNAYIQFDEGNNVIDLSGVSSTIYLNKDFIGETVPTEAGMQQMPFWLVVGHELSHRVDYLKRRNEVSKIWIEEENVKIKNTEIQATHYENLMREEANLPLRTHYATISAGRNVMPYEPSRLINKKGRSIVLPNVYYTPIRKRK